MPELKVEHLLSVKIYRYCSPGFLSYYTKINHVKLSLILS